MKGKFTSVILAICFYISGYSQQFNSITDSRDGQKYRIFKIGEQW
jgi:hypothetical protein